MYKWKNFDSENYLHHWGSQEPHKILLHANEFWHWKRKTHHEIWIQIYRISLLLVTRCLHMQLKISKITTIFKNKSWKVNCKVCVKKVNTENSNVLQINSRVKLKKTKQSSWVISLIQTSLKSNYSWNSLSSQWCFKSRPLF